MYTHKLKINIKTHILALSIQLLEDYYSVSHTCPFLYCGLAKYSDIILLELGCFICFLRKKKKTFIHILYILTITYHLMFWPSVLLDTGSQLSL